MNLEDRLLTYAIRLSPWWLLEWIMPRYRLCRATVVLVKMNGDEVWGGWNSLRPSGECWSGMAGHEYDFCGVFETYQEFHQAEGTPVYFTFAGDDDVQEDQR